MLGLKRIFLGLVLLSLAIFSSACSDPAKEVRVYNATEYIADGVIEQFEEETGYKVIYSEFISNEDMYTKIKTTSYDVLIPSDYMIDKLVKEDLLSELNFDNIPNFEKVDPQFKGGYYDPDNKYSVPYMWSTVGILYDSEKVSEEVTSLDIMWNENYSGKIFMMDSVRDTIGMTLKMLGYSVNTTDDGELSAVMEKLTAERPLVLGYVTDEVTDKIISGQGTLGLIYSGEAGKAIAEKPSVRYAIPETGSIYCVDAMVVPKAAKNKDGAESFINFMQRPEIAAKNAAEVYYGITNSEGKELLPEEVKNNEALYPGEEAIARCEMLKNSDEISKKYLDLWNQLMAN